MDTDDDHNGVTLPVKQNIIRRRSQRGNFGDPTEIDPSSPHTRAQKNDGTTTNSSSASCYYFESVASRALTLFSISAFIFLILNWIHISLSPSLAPNIPGGQHERAGSLDLPPLKPAHHQNRLPRTILLKWNVTKGERSPDGVKKKVYLINDNFIGPTIEAMSGDTIHLDLFNKITDEGIAIHFHGLEMRGFNAMDGAVGMTQDPVRPGGNMTYHFKISENQAGTFWYHSHSQIQRGDGLYGAFIVHSPQEYDVIVDEERVIMINDWYHRSSLDALAWYMRSSSFGIEPVPDSILINGVGAYNCSKAVPARPVECMDILSRDMMLKMRFDATKRYRLRFINSGMLAGITISIPGASMTVLEIDGGQRVQPEMAASFGILYPGQRIDVLIQWPTGNDGKMTISLDQSAFRFSNPALSPTQSFPLELEGHSNKSVLHQDNRHVDLLDLSPLFNLNLPRIANQTILLYTTTMKLARLSNIPHGFINHTTWKAQSPPLISLSRSEYNSHQLVPFIPYAPDSDPLWVDIVLNNLDDDDHPFHMHGYAPWVLQTHSEGWGFGSWNPFQDDIPPGGELNPDRALRRDTFIVPRRGYVILRFKADNYGIWMFHCHVLWHLGSGMSMAIEVGQPGVLINPD
ncbi:Cupredoxin [Xylariaceae sp. FL0255]|nr:Cupredoxin [Xylariaceae sp. FL0255]